MYYRKLLKGEKVSKKKILTIAAVLSVLALMFPASVPIAAAVINYTPTDVGPKIREWEATADGIDTSAQPGSLSKMPVAVLPTTVGAQQYFLILNDYTGKYQVTVFTLKAQSSKTQIWVQNSLAWPAGDPPPNTGYYNLPVKLYAGTV